MMIEDADPSVDLSRKRVLLVEDHALVRQGLHNLIDGCADLEIVGEATNGIEALELTRQLRPDVIVMDVRMPGMDGIEATRLIKSEFPDVTVIGLSADDRPEQRMTLKEAGAAGCLTKGDDAEAICEAIRIIPPRHHT